MKDCRAIVALCLCRFGVLRQGVYGNVPCRNQTLLLGRVASRCGGGGCLDSVVQLSGVLLERCLKSGVRHDGLADSGSWRGELSNTHKCPPQNSLYRWSGPVVSLYGVFALRACLWHIYSCKLSRKPR